MAKLSYHLDVRRPLSDGTFPVKLRITIKGRKKVILSTGISVNEGHWLGGRVIGGRDRNTVNNILAFRYNRVQDFILDMDQRGKLTSVDDKKLKILLSSVFLDQNILDVDDSTNFFNYYKSFIANKTKQNTINKYNYTIDKIGQYYNLKMLDFKELNLSLDIPIKLTPIRRGKLTPQS